MLENHCCQYFLRDGYSKDDIDVVVFVVMLSYFIYCRGDILYSAMGLLLGFLGLMQIMFIDDLYILKNWLIVGIWNTFTRFRMTQL